VSCRFTRSGGRPGYDGESRARGTPQVTAATPLKSRNKEIIAVKSAVENLDPTRVRLTVEVPFEELKPSLDAAYKKIAAQVNVPGFRKGKVPPPIIDQRIGRIHVIEEAVNDALPKLYDNAVRENKLDVVGRPEVSLDEVNDGAELKFTAEVDVRPEITLPDLDDLTVEIDDAEVTDERLTEAVDTLRDRFASLRPVERAAQDGDHITVDLSATIDGEPYDEAETADMSYEVGSGTMVDGLDEAVTGLSAGEEATFATTMVGGAHAGDEAQVTVKVTAVKEKDLPELDDEFAQLASEFDTLDELRADTRSRLERTSRVEQASQARDRLVDALLEAVDIPLPGSVVAAELEWRNESLNQQLEMSGMTRDGFLKLQEKTSEEFDAELEQQVRNSVKTQFILDKVADTEQLAVNQQELTSYLIQRAAGTGLTPDQFAQQVVEANQVPTLVGEVRRGKAVQSLLEKATIKDTSGNVVDFKTLIGEDVDVVDAEAVETVEAAEEAAAGENAED
jgi:trigger factor